MNPHRLRYFIAVAEELNFTRAAERLHVAQPSLSVQIAKLETEVGADLFIRMPRGVQLSEAGMVFLQRSYQMLDFTEESISMARRAANAEIGHLSIGYCRAIEFSVFPEVVPAFRKIYPDVHLSLHSFRAPKLIERLRRNELDLALIWTPVPAEPAFVWSPVPPDEFDIAPLTSTSPIAALPADHRLASASAVTIKDLDGEPLILFPSVMDAVGRRQIEQLFDNAGANMNVVVEVDTLFSAINFVELGAGCSILADYVHRPQWNGVVYKPIISGNIEMTLAIVKSRDSNYLTQSFYNFVIDKFHQQREPI